MKSVLSVFLFMSLVACSSKQAEEVIAVRQEPDMLYGVWEYGVPFYSSTLVLNNDHTFQMESTGCAGTTKWRGSFSLLPNQVLMQTDPGSPSEGDDRSGVAFTARFVLKDGMLFENDTRGERGYKKVQ